MSGGNWVAGGVASLDPLVTYSMGGHPRELGLPGLYPELFRNRHGLHFIALSRSIETFDKDEFAADFNRLQADLGDNLLVVVANDDYENLELSRRGVTSFPASHLALIDETVFKPMPPPAGAPTFDAVYNARLDALKRHELAADIGTLMLVYYQIADGTDQLGRVKRALPNAYFANHALTGREISWIGADKVVGLMAQARVGLCLSAIEGAMRAAMEYLLCGLCVVSTESIGGRDRYLMPPYAMIVEPDPAAVAAGVREMIARNIPKAVVRDHIGRILTFERHQLLETANRIAHSHFGIDELFSSVAPLARYANTWRPAGDAIAPLVARGVATPAKEPAPVPAAPVEAAADAEPRAVAVVLARGRSGTHLLRSILSQEKTVETVSEVFNQDLARNIPHNFNAFFISYIAANPDWRMSAKEADKIIEAYFDDLLRTAQRPIVIVDVKQDELRMLDWPSTPVEAMPRLLRFIHRNIDWPIVHVARRDTLAQYGSLLLAQETGHWQLPTAKADQDRSKTTVRFEPAKVMAVLRNCAAADAAMDGWLAGRPRTTTVTYETMLDGERLSADARRNIGGVLGLDLSPDALAGTVKLAPPLREYVENLDEILDLLRDTPFAWLIDLHRAP